MTGDFDTIQAVSNVYAKALLGLASEAGQEDAIDGELQSLHDLFGRDADFRAFLSSPAIDRAQRRNSLRRLFDGKLSSTVLNLLLVLNDKHRLSMLPFVCDTYRRQLEAGRGQARVMVTSAVRLTEEQRTRLAEMVVQATRIKPILYETVDEAVLGGIRIQMGDREIDRTVARRLRLIRNELLAGVDSHLHGGRTFVTES